MAILDAQIHKEQGVAPSSVRVRHVIVMRGNNRIECIFPVKSLKIPTVACVNKLAPGGRCAGKLSGSFEYLVPRELLPVVDDQVAIRSKALLFESVLPL